VGDCNLKEEMEEKEQGADEREGRCLLGISFSQGRGGQGGRERKEYVITLNVSLPQAGEQRSLHS
jgi:hypothetical protein